MSQLGEKWQRLIGVLKREQGVLVAYSGGCDSALLVSAAQDALPADRVLAVTAISDSLALSDRQFAANLAKKIGVEHTELQTSEINNPNYVANGSNRCFFCKDELFSQLAPLAKVRNMRLVDGLSRSDRGDFRPGVKAAAQWNVLHPLDEVDLYKSEIRTLSRWRKLPSWNKPASPCLASRIPYGRPVLRREMRRVELAESMLHREGFRILRVRHLENEARIEIPCEEIFKLQEASLWTRVVAEFRALGFRKISVDSEGFRSGKLNDALKNPDTRHFLAGRR